LVTGHSGHGAKGMEHKNVVVVDVVVVVVVFLHLQFLIYHLSLGAGHWLS